MRLCFDVDGVIAKGGHPYSKCEPYPHAVKALKALKEAGHTIILHTARYMSYYEGNRRKAERRGKQELIDWLEKHEIPYDEIYMAKPSADLYIDDKAARIISDRGEYPWQVLINTVNK